MRVHQGPFKSREELIHVEVTEAWRKFREWEGKKEIKIGDGKNRKLSEFGGNQDEKQNI